MARALPLIPWSKTSILNCRMHLNSSRIAQHAALDLFVLGFPHQANKLLESIHKYGLDTTTWDYYGHTTEEQLQGAWTTSDTFPTWARRADHADTGSISTAGLPNDIATKAEEGTLSKEDVETIRERLNMKPDATYRHAGETMTLGAVTQVALLADEHRLATSLVEDNMKELYQYLLDNWDNPDRSGDETRHYIFRRQGLEYCPGIWPVLASVKLGDRFGVRASDVDEYVKEGCALIEKRSTEGPARPYRSKTMAELVKMVDKNILTEREDSGEDTIPTVLKDGATEAQIAALEKRLSSPDEHSFIALPGGKLPDDYNDFLRASNGIDEDIFYSTDEVNTSGSWMHDMDYTLFPNENNGHLLHGSDRDFDEIELGDYACFTIGTGDGFKALFENNGVDVNLQDDEGSSLLHQAVQFRYESVVKMLMEREGVNVNIRNKRGQSPLWVAASCGYKDIVKLMVEHDRVDLEARDENDQTPLSAAVMQQGGRLMSAATTALESVVEALLASGKVDPDAKDTRGLTPLAWASRTGEGSVRIADMLISTGKVDVNSKDKSTAADSKKA
ncbi:hypothetical protein J4E83_006438 [Alternaria metachromatica]|uniref:uncharacterized protein n=1 Tax=Alternaria metachromatica TaxID=283354 RepID=UPI0020C47A74|nr:uncharacterized protein J4E83_006438 [Alternaria metachromatica]KAI4616857.1 hypothetical protein J4E83_006438 [Alternaria metachromatica]